MTSHANTTPIPPGIAMPDEVRTRLGTLRFFDGVPDDAATRTLFDNLDFQRAVQAYLLGLAPVAVAAMRKALVQWGPVNATLVMWADLVHPRFLGLVYNTSTSYHYAWLDLRDGPVVVEVPPEGIRRRNRSLVPVGGRRGPHRTGPGPRRPLPVRAAGLRRAGAGR